MSNNNNNPNAKCLSCGQWHPKRFFIFGICKQCQDYIIKRRAEAFRVVLEERENERLVSLQKECARLEEELSKNQKKEQLEEILEAVLRYFET